MIFFVLLGMVLIWFVLITMLFRRLEQFHPEKYAEMGRPSLFLRNHIEGNLSTMKFLLARRHRQLNDAYLSNLSDAMMVLLAVYTLLFLWHFLTAVLGNHQPTP